MNSEGYSDPTADKAVGRVTAAKRAAVEYLQSIYPEWRKEDVIFDKYRD